MQEFQPLCGQLTSENINPCQVAARAGEVGDKAAPDRVFADEEHDGGRGGCRLGSERRISAGRGDHGDLSAKQFGGQLRQPVNLIFGPAVFDRHVLAFNIGGVFEALAKSAKTLRECVGRPAVEESDHRHRRLLRLARQAARWPPRCRAA
jgi:hypothetical protein